ncbi:MAG: ribosome maturation factor RimP [Eubacteriales bacterium]|nr:ribosome maturation factor RimP [Eubacteriales bacterium]
MSKITDTVWSLAAPVAESQGCEIWDVEYVKEAGTRILRVYIDKAAGVGIDDCEAFSRALDPILDEADPIPESYTFEVSSAGAERTLRRPSDFSRFMGENVEVKFYRLVDGRKNCVGKLLAYDDGAVTVAVGTQELRFEKEQIAQVRLRIV